MTEYWCINCQDEVNPKRVALGFKTCLLCGEVESRKQTEAKAQRQAPIHKSNYVYITDGMLREDMNSLGRKV